MPKSSVLTGFAASPKASFAGHAAQQKMPAD